MNKEILEKGNNYIVIQDDNGAVRIITLGNVYSAYVKTVEADNKQLIVDIENGKTLGILKSRTQDPAPVYSDASLCALPSEEEAKNRVIIDGEWMDEHHFKNKQENVLFKKTYGSYVEIYETRPYGSITNSFLTVEKYPGTNPELIEIAKRQTEEASARREKTQEKNVAELSARLKKAGFSPGVKPKGKGFLWWGK